MKNTGGFLNWCIVIWLAIIPTTDILTQSIHPQNVFDAGLNMGYIVGHHEKGAQHSDAPIWAGNVAAEWLGSWRPGTVGNVTVNLDNPENAHQEMTSAMRAMEGCGEPYYNLRFSFYNLGFHFGNALVETNYNCGSCLQKELQRSAIEMRTIGQLLKSSQWQEMADEMNEQSQNLDLGLDSALLVQQNTSQYSFLEAQLYQLNKLLPDKLIPCEEEAEKEESDKNTQPEKMTAKPEVEKEASTVEVKIEDERKEQGDKTQVHISAGYTAAYILGDEGPVSNRGGGFYLGLDMLNGKNLFLISGIDFYRNSAGKRFLVPSQGQVVDSGQYIQGFRVHLGLGAHLINTKNLAISPFAKFHMFVGSSINGEYSSLGQAMIADVPLDLNIGTYISYKFFSFHASYEFGLRPILLFSDIPLKYRMWNFGLGVRF